MVPPMDQCLGTRLGTMLGPQGSSCRWLCGQGYWLCLSSSVSTASNGLLAPPEVYVGLRTGSSLSPGGLPFLLLAPSTSTHSGRGRTPPTAPRSQITAHIPVYVFLLPPLDHETLTLSRSPMASCTWEALNVYWVTQGHINSGKVIEARGKSFCHTLEVT